MKKFALLVFVTSTSFLMAHGGGCGCGKKPEATPEKKKNVTCVGDKCPVQPKPAEQPGQVATPVSNPQS